MNGTGTSGGRAGRWRWVNRPVVSCASRHAERRIEARGSLGRPNDRWQDCGVAGYVGTSGISARSVWIQEPLGMLETASPPPESASTQSPVRCFDEPASVGV